MSRKAGPVPNRSQKTEAQIQAEVIQFLQSEKVFCHSVPNEGSGSDLIRTTQLIAMGLRKGVADLVVWWPVPSGSRIGYLEMKRPGGRQSKEQLAFEAKCHSLDIPYDLAHSVDEVRDLLAGYRRNG